MAIIYLYFVLAFLVALMAQIRGRTGWRWFLIALFTTPLLGGLLVMALPRQEQPPAMSTGPRRAAASEGVPLSAESTVRLIRLSTEADRFRPYNVFINGAQVGAIVPNSIVDYHVPSGALVIEARSDRGISPPLLVEAAPGHRVDIEVANGWGPLSRVWAAAFRSDHYLTLTKLTAAETADAVAEELHAPAA